MKRFLKLFFILLFSEIILGMLAVFLQQGVYVKALNLIGSIIMFIISLPASLIDRTYPYYSPEPWPVTLLILVVNIALHTALVVVIINTGKRG